MKKTAFCVCENDVVAAQLADQRLCFSYKDLTIPLVPKSKS